MEQTERQESVADPQARSDHPVNVPWELGRTVDGDPMVYLLTPNGERRLILALYAHRGDRVALANHIVRLHNAWLAKTLARP